jgi:hypothetical protein
MNVFCQAGLPQLEQKSKRIYYLYVANTIRVCTGKEEQISREITILLNLLQEMPSQLLFFHL